VCTYACACACACECVCELLYACVFLFACIRWFLRLDAILLVARRWVSLCVYVGVCICVHFLFFLCICVGPLGSEVVLLVARWRVLCRSELEYICSVCVGVNTCVNVCKWIGGRSTGKKAAGGVLQCAAVCCSVLQCVAVCCSALQCVAVCCSVFFMRVRV